VDSVTAESVIEIFQASNEIQHVGARVRTAGGRTEVSATTERTTFVNETIASGRIEHWAYSGRLRRQACPATLPQGRGRKDRFALRYQRRPTGELEMAAVFPSFTEALDWPFGQCLINCARFIASFACGNRRLD
jgi:hypothetical protein